MLYEPSIRAEVFFISQRNYTGSRLTEYDTAGHDTYPFFAPHAPSSFQPWLVTSRS